MTDWTLLSPPSPKKREYSAAAKVIQGHTRAYLAKKAANRPPPSSPPSASSPANGKTLTYQGAPVQVPVAANWKPKRAPKEHIDDDFDWDGWRDAYGEAERDAFIGMSVANYINSKRLSRFSPGDIITIGDFPLLFHFYISLTGVVKEIPLNDDDELFYIPRGVMEPFYKHRDATPRLYGAAVLFYSSFLLERNPFLVERHPGRPLVFKDYVLHQYHRSTETIDHYDYKPETGEVVIKRNVPITGALANHLAGRRIRSSSGSSGSSAGGSKKTRVARKKKSNT